jgi:4-amino-4-deoxy-L-arabinose transferase-like glycosyltransferase
VDDQPLAATPVSPRRPVLAWAGWAGLAAWFLTIAFWMLHVGGHEHHTLPRITMVLALAASAVWLGGRLVRALAGRSGRERALVLLLPILLVLSLAVRFTGLSHEVDGRYYLDEGTYYHHASGIDAGRWLRLSFVYPHLMYYLDAFALWVTGLFPGVAARWAGAIGVSDPLSIQWLALRGVVALLSALTVVPVFRIAERLGGRRAGAVSALLLIFSPLYNDGSHLNICDVPSAFFATLCLLWVARLIDAESIRDYVLAGICAGLAAGSKYPAGVVAVTIVAVWLRWRIARRDWSFGLLWAGLAAAGTFVAVMPSMVVFPEAAFLGNRGIFFGVHQYGQGGWLGVMPESNPRFYGGHLAESFGWIALVAGLAGFFVTRRAELVRRLWMLPYPLVYLALIASMNMVVKRNLYPVIPMVSVLLGVGLAGWAGRLLALPRPAFVRAALVSLFALACLWMPAEATFRQDVSFASPSTREEALVWIRAHVPRGASILKESYTPDFAPGEYEISHLRFAGRLSLEELRQFQYVLLASAAYQRFLDAGSLRRPHQQEIARNYAEMFRTFELVKQWEPAEAQLGPELRLYRPR